MNSAEPGRNIRRDDQSSTNKARVDGTDTPHMSVVVCCHSEVISCRYLTFYDMAINN